MRMLKYAVLFLAPLLGSRHAMADLIYDVYINTTPLVGHPAGPFYFEVAMVDGSGIGDGNNTVDLSNFNFGGGSSLGNPVSFGGASGSLETGISMTDSSFLGLFVEQFAPGLSINFTLGVTANNYIGGIPDGLDMFILDNSGVPLPTLAPSADYFISADLETPGPDIHTYGSDPSRAPSVGNPVSIAAPTITPVGTAPEPRTWGVVGTALIAMMLSRRRLIDRRRC